MIISLNSKPETIKGAVSDFIDSLKSLKNKKKKTAILFSVLTTKPRDCGFVILFQNVLLLLLLLLQVVNCGPGVSSPSLLITVMTEVCIK